MNSVTRHCPACGHSGSEELIPVEPLGVVCSECACELLTKRWERFEATVTLALAAMSTDSGELDGARLVRSMRVQAPTAGWAATVAVREVRGMLRADVPCDVIDVDLHRDSVTRGDASGAEEEMIT